MSVFLNLKIVNTGAIATAITLNAITVTRLTGLNTISSPRSGKAFGMSTVATH